MTSYLYQAVDGCAVLQRSPKTIQRAKHIVAMHRMDGRASAEIERVEILPTGSRSYWRWRSGQWRFWDASEPTSDDLQRWETV